MATISPRVTGSIVTKTISGSIQTSRKYELYTGETTVTPTESVQTLATENKNMASDITINAIDSEYVGSDVPRKDSSSLTANGKTVTAPAGFYENAASKDVADGSATTPDTTITVEPTLVVSSAGLIIADVSDSESITPTVAEGWVSSGTAGTVSVSGSKTLQLTTQAAKTVAPTESVQTAVAKNVYTTGVVKVGAISSTYVGSGITRQDSSSLTVSAYDGTTYSVADTEPYLYRQTPSGAGDMARVDKIVGATVGWNQQMQEISSTYWSAMSDATATFSDGVATITASASYKGISAKSATRPTIVSGHKYLISYDIKPTTSNTPIRLNFAASGVGTSFDISSNTAGTWQTITRIKNAGASVSSCEVYFQDKRSSDWDTFYIRNFMLVDLTAMFGSTIADYVYTLEQATTGSGLAWLKSYGYFTQPYYSYSAPTLTGVKTSGRRTVGFNLWDEQWEVGGINNSTGENTLTITDRIRSKNYIPIFPSTTYYCEGLKGSSTVCEVFFYDAGKNYIKYIPNTSYSNGQFTTPSNAYYMKFRNYVGYGTTYNSDICFNISNSDRNGDYEPYITRTYPTDTVTLNGILKLSNGKLYAEGDEYGYDGTVTTKYGVVTLNGTQTVYSSNWRPTATSVGWLYNLFGAEPQSAINEKPPVISDKLTAETYSSMYNGTVDSGVSINTTGLVCIRVADTSLTNNTAINTYLANNPITIVYPLATATTSTADPFEQYQSGSAYGTEEWLDTRSVPMPVPSSTTYNATNSGATVTAPSGWYSESASKTVPAGSVQVSEKDITATISLSVDSAGLVTATTTASDLITAEVTDGYVSGDANAPMRVSGSNTLQITVYDGSVS